MLADGKRETTTSQLAINPTDLDIGRVFSCRSTNEAIPGGKETFVKLNVHRESTMGAEGTEGTGTWHGDVAHGSHRRRARSFQGVGCCGVPGGSQPRGLGLPKWCLGGWGLRLHPLGSPEPGCAGVRRGPAGDGAVNTDLQWLLREGSMATVGTQRYQGWRVPACGRDGGYPNLSGMLDTHI